MRIAIITDGLASGGAERQIVISAAELVRRGHDVEILAYHRDNDFGEFLRRHGVPLTVIDASGPLSRVERVAGLSRRLRARRFDVVHAFKDTPSVWGRLAAKLAGVPCVFGGYRMMDRVGPASRAVQAALSFREAGFIVLSEGAREVVVRDFHVPPERVFVVYNAVHPDTYDSALSPGEAKSRLGIAPERAVVSIVANLRPEKDHETFFAMARRLGGSGRRPAFLVVGDGPLRERVAALHAGSGLGADVRLLGHQENIADVWRATDVAVITSLHEGLCSALVEAGAAGLPCVSTDNGGAREVLDDGRTGFLVPLRDAGAMAERVGVLLDDPELRARVGAAARERVMGRFSLDAMTDSLIGAYETGLASAGRRW
jgi:glycosyltransferase involved in cell wall biosynthesis